MNLITPGLTFDAREHRYHLHATHLVSVTQCLHTLGLIDSTHYTVEARERGSAVHEAIHYLIEDDLDWDTVPESIEGYLDAHQKFSRESGMLPIGAEWLMADPLMGYAGALDLFGLLRDESVIIDYKTGCPEPWHALQLAAYLELVAANREHLGLKPHELPSRGLVCHLAKDGTYKLVDPCREARPKLSWRQARGLWMGALGLLNYHPQRRERRAA